MSHIVEAIDLLHEATWRAVSFNTADGKEWVSICKFCQATDVETHDTGCIGQKMAEAIALLDDCNAECACPEEKENA